jgi:hypothetical protein
MAAEQMEAIENDVVAVEHEVGPLDVEITGVITIVRLSSGGGVRIRSSQNPYDTIGMLKMAELAMAGALGA